MTKQWVADQPELLVAVRALEAHKASAIVAIDLRGLTDATDFFLIASGSSNTHVRALGNRVIDALHAVGRKPHHVEGLSQGRWVLIDFVDFVVHVFHPTLREYYRLERLWVEGPTVTIGSPD